MDNSKFETIAKLLRYYSLLCSTKAGSGHPTSSLSAADLLAVLYFQFFKYDFKNPKNKFNDRLIFSKGHASPLLYSLYKVAGLISEEELLTYRTLTSPLQGHPTPETPYVDVATGSLGMGLSFGLGMAIATQLDKIENKTYVLLGDGEMAEGSVWESLVIAAHYKTKNLVAILDVNGLGQTGPTMYGHNAQEYQKKIAAFGWNTEVINGHDITEIHQAFQNSQVSDKPFMIIANTHKGHGISFLEDKSNWHGKALKIDEFENAEKELSLTQTDKEQIFKVDAPTKSEKIESNNSEINFEDVVQEILGSSDKIAARKAYGLALRQIVKNDPTALVLDAEVFNSTFAELAQKEKPEQFLNMYIAEQNMIGVATGASKLGKKVFASSFAAFLTRAFDQIRMSSISESNIKISGSHAGVSIGEDGASQMGLEDIAMMRSVHDSVVLYPSDAVSTIRLVGEMQSVKSISYIRTTREATENIYDQFEQFPIGGSKTLYSSEKDRCTVVAAGITLHETLKAYEELKNQGISIRVIDLYSIKPIDIEGLQKAASETNNKIITVEDHNFDGGLGDAVLNVFASTPVQIFKMAITERPHSGKPMELLEKYGISANHIIAKVKEII